jgi:hypothetical protein
MDVLVLIDKLDDLVHNAKQVPLTDQVAWTKRRSTTSSTRCGPRSPRRSSRPAGSSRSVRRCSPRPSARPSGSSRRRASARRSSSPSRRSPGRPSAPPRRSSRTPRAREREIRLGAEDYADEILNTLEVNLSKFIAAVQRGRERLQGREEPAEVAER